MLSHLTRSETYSFVGSRRYTLNAKLHPTPEEMQIIVRNRLDLMELFHDPVREALFAAAAASHQQARSRGLFVTSARDAAAVCVNEISAVISTVRALRAFNITVADLVHPDGVTITHKSLQAIREVEQALTECIDYIDRIVRSAQSYVDETEDLLAPGDEGDVTPPSEWPRAWRR